MFTYSTNFSFNLNFLYLFIVFHFNSLFYLFRFLLEFIIKMNTVKSRMRKNLLYFQCHLY